MILYCCEKQIPFTLLLKKEIYVKIEEMYKLFHTMDEKRSFKKIDEILKTIPTKLELLRKKNNLSNKDLSLITNIPVRTLESYQRREKNINKINGDILYKLSLIFQCKIEEILEV
jgi:DNA-binding transcriptional regulator YiaG